MIVYKTKIMYNITMNDRNIPQKLCDIEKALQRLSTDKQSNLQREVTAIGASLQKLLQPSDLSDAETQTLIDILHSRTQGLWESVALPKRNSSDAQNPDLV